MFDLRYHVASLAAVFLMLVVGILIGVGISGRGFVDDVERNNFEREIAGLKEDVDAANATAARLGRGVITVVPVTSNVERVYPFQVLLPAAETGLERDSKAQAEQIRSIAVERVGDRLGIVPNAIMLDIDEALRLHLGL